LTSGVLALQAGNQHNMTTHRIGTALALITLATCLASPAARAQDFGGIFKGLLTDRATDLMNMAIKSITDVSFGQVTQGAQAPQDAEGKIVLYSTPWCGYCKRAAAHMQQKNIAFVERNIEANPAFKAEYRNLGGKGGVPFIVFGGRTMMGFSESSFDNHYAEFQRSQATAAATTGASPTTAPVARSGTTGSGVVLQPGDALVGRVAGIPVYTQPNKKSPRLAALTRTDEVIYMGEEQEGFYRVTSALGEGWVDKLLVKKN
jgi:glutaredoxin